MPKNNETQPPASGATHLAIPILVLRLNTHHHNCLEGDTPLSQFLEHFSYFRVVPSI